MNLFERFARESKETGFMKYMRYKQQCNKIWTRQMAALAQEAAYDSDSDGSDVDVDNNVDENERDKNDPFANFMGDKAAEVDDLNELIEITSAPQNTASSSVPQPAVQSAPVDLFSGDRVRPAKAVKTIRRYVRSDGTECIEVSFKLSEEDVARVERDALRKRASLNSTGMTLTLRRQQKDY